MKRLCLKTVSGFSLVEVVIAATISLMAIVSVMSIFIASSKMTVESMLINQSAMQARIVIDHLTADIRSATAVEDSFGAYTASADTLILKLPSIDANGFPTDIDKDFDRVIYHPATEGSKKLVRSVVASAASSRPSSDKVIGYSKDTKINLSGTYQVLPDALGAYVIYYKFTAVQAHGSKSYETPIAGSVRLRNRA